MQHYLHVPKGSTFSGLGDQSAATAAAAAVALLTTYVDSLSVV